MLALALISYLVIIWAIQRAVRRSLVKTMRDRPHVDVEKSEEALNRLFHTTCGLIIIAIAIFLVLAELRIDIAALVAVFSAVAIAVGFATRNLGRDLIAGAIITIENQYNVGDVITSLALCTTNLGGLNNGLDSGN